jgi:hypothetical protein
MNIARDEAHALADDFVRLRITTKTRSANGFLVKWDGAVIHRSPTHREALAFLRAWLRANGRKTLRVEPAP